MPLRDPNFGDLGRPLPFHNLSLRESQNVDAR